MSLTTPNPVRRPLPWLGVVAFAAVVLVALPVSAGEIYQWKDARGVTHYSDSPPPNQAYKNRTITHSGASQAAATVSASAQPGENAQCTSARTRLGQLQKNAPVGLDADGDGKPDSIFTTEQRAAQTASAQAAVKVHCTASNLSAAEG
ncbi:MAG: DUF4124 domain-containing protein [Pseudomonadota bacterium]|nr:DUF4124 domain-containing protein [Pseudomonadota bacterium]